MNRVPVVLFDRLLSERYRHLRLAIVLLLGSATLLSGCMHDTDLEPEEQTATLQASDSKMNVTLKDGAVITAEAHHYLAVAEAANILYVSGTYRHPGTGDQENFVGKIEPTAVDTTREGSTTMVRFSLGNGSSVTCRPADCLAVDSAGGPGLWAVGIRHEGGSTSEFRGKIDQANIAAIEFRKTNGVATALLITGGVAVVSVVALAIAVGSSMSDFRLGWGR